MLALTSYCSCNLRCREVSCHITSSHAISFAYRSTWSCRKSHHVVSGLSYVVFARCLFVLCRVASCRVILFMPYFSRAWSTAERSNSRASSLFWPSAIRQTIDNRTLTDITCKCTRTHTFTHTHAQQHICKHPTRIYTCPHTHTHPYAYARLHLRRRFSQYWCLIAPSYLIPKQLFEARFSQHSTTLHDFHRCPASISSISARPLHKLQRCRIWGVSVTAEIIPHKEPLCQRRKMRHPEEDNTNNSEGFALNASWQHCILLLRFNQSNNIVY